jgi:hypothetical protein
VAYKNKDDDKKWREANEDHLKQYKRDYYRRKYGKNREKMCPKPKRRTDHLKRYGITINEWEKMFEKQGKICALCGSDVPAKHSNRWNTDHDHDTGIIRGIICCSCNNGLGLFKDDPVLLRKAANYIELSKPLNFLLDNRKKPEHYAETQTIETDSNEHDPA